MSNPVSDLIKAHVKTSKHHKGGKDDKEYNYFRPWDVGAFLFQGAKEHGRWPDSFHEFEANTIEYMLGLHMLSFRDRLFEWADSMTVFLRGQPKKSAWWGDMDNVCDLIVDTPKKTVFHCRNTCTCSDESEWIVIYDRNEVHPEIHVRVIWRDTGKTGGYRRPSYGWHVERPSLKFWKDRDYSMEYKEEWQMGKLGGVYGDGRDKGYVISYEKWTGKLAELTRDKDTDSLWCHYSSWRHFMWQVLCMVPDKNNG